MEQIDKTRLVFGPGKENENCDFKIRASSSELKNSYEYLIFTDSKGISIENENIITWTDNLISTLENKGLSYLFISRPKEMTVFFSLINFLKLNNINFRNLITNVGFVDTTPKKNDFINDILMQSPFQKDKTSIYAICDYELNSGEIATLYSVRYNKFFENISKAISNNFERAFLLGTFEFSPDIAIERKRPDEFYSQLNETNNLLKSICYCNNNLNFIDVNGALPKEGSDLSYDAVHFTQRGHDQMTSICKNKIDF